MKIGVHPNNELVRGRLELDAQGHVVVDRRQQTSVPWIYAVGDVCNPDFSSIANAVGQGMVAAKDLKGKLRGAGGYQKL